VIDVDERALRQTADGVGQDVLQVLGGARDARRPARVFTVPRRRVIPGQLRQLPIAEEIRARMPDVRDEQIVARAVRGGQRRGHARQHHVRPALRDHGIVDPAVEPLRALLDLCGCPGIDPQVPLAEVDREVRERAERDTAGRPAGP